MIYDSFIEQLLENKDELVLAFFPKKKIGKLLETICGLLNTEGGWILIGYNENSSDSFHLTEGEIYQLKKEINSYISPQPIVYITSESYKSDKNVTLINVLKGQRQPYTYKDNYYIYKNDQASLASPDDISLMLRNSPEYTSTWEKITLVDASIEDLSTTELERTMLAVVKMSEKEWPADNKEEFLNYFQLSDFGNIKNGAMLLFGLEPAKFLQQCRIRISVLPGGKMGDVYDDTIIIESNLFKAFSQVKEYFRKYNPMRSEFKPDEWDRNMESKFPNDALDEAVVNAMVHRDYSDASGEVTINIYPNKIDIINSGEIPSEIIKGKNDIKPHHSILRNPIIAHMFFVRGKMEKIGRGLNLIYKRFMERGYRKPEWNSERGYTTLSLFSEPLVIELNHRMERFLRSFNGSNLTREEYERFFDMEFSEKTARNDLSGLVQAGYLRKSGRGPKTKYVLTSKRLPDISG